MVVACNKENIENKKELCSNETNSSIQPEIIDQNSLDKKKKVKKRKHTSEKETSSKKIKKIKINPEENDSNSIISTKKEKKINNTINIETDLTFNKVFYKRKKTNRMSKIQTKEYRTKHNITIDGIGSKKFRPLNNFNDLGFDKKFMKVCKDFKEPTPIQSQCWPVIASGRDIIGIAETGSGKTLAFVIPALPHIAQRLENLSSNNLHPIMLIVAPTRELAMQSQKVLESAGKSCSIRSACVYGGVSKHDQKVILKSGVEVIVATPGRLCDLMNDTSINLKNVSYLVLDEADRMLDQGFERDIRKIISATSPNRQTCLFSATWPDSVQSLASEFLLNPVKVTIGSQDLAAGKTITQIVEVVDEFSREQKLKVLLKKYHINECRIIIFALYKKEAARLEKNLWNCGWNCVSIHGDKSQEMRTKAVEDFKKGTIPLLIATDVASRGLDIPDVEFVINYSFPLTIEDYVHRIGRTGRAGKSGIAHTFFHQGDKARAGELVNVLKESNQPIPEEMMKFDLSIKRKEHKLWGAFGPKEDLKNTTSTKIIFDD